MKCQQSRKLFGAYWDDELTQGEREWLEAHFASCASCRTEYEQFAHTLEVVGSLPRIEVEPGLAERALARARRASPVADRVPTSPTARWIPITAAAALIATLGATALQWTGVTGRVARHETTPVEQPLLVTGGTSSTPQVPERIGPASDAVALEGAISDTLFDPDQDIEFILDPVTLRKGRAHPPTQLAPEKSRGQQAVITF